MTPDEEAALVRAAQRGDALAVDRLMTALRPAASALAERRGATVHAVDQALARVRDHLWRYDKARSPRFTEWAAWWLRASIWPSRS